MFEELGKAIAQKKAIHTIHFEGRSFHTFEGGCAAWDHFNEELLLWACDVKDVDFSDRRVFDTVEELVAAI